MNRCKSGERHPHAARLVGDGTLHDADDGVLAVVEQRYLVADLLLQRPGQFLAQEDALLVGGGEPVPAGLDVQGPHGRRIDDPALHDQGADAQFLQRGVIDQSRVDLFDAGDFGDFVAQFVAQDAGQSLLGAALLDDDGHLLILVDGQERLDRNCWRCPPGRPPRRRRPPCR